MKSRESSYSDEVEFVLTMPVNVTCYACKNYQTVNIRLDEFGVDHTDWTITPPNDFNIEWALKESDTKFRMCSILDYAGRDRELVAPFCPECMKKRDDLVLVVEKKKK